MYVYLAVARLQAIHFYSPGQGGSIKAMVCSIAVQLAQRLPAMRNNLLGQLRSGDLSAKKTDEATADGLFDRLLRGPLGAEQQQVAGGQPLVVIIDALNASDRNNGQGCPGVLSMLADK